MPRALVAAVLLACVVSPACFRHPNVRDDPFYGMKVDDQQTALALTAVSRLKAQFNAGSCRSIYETSGAAFRFQNAHDWEFQCTNLQLRFGKWRDFQFKFSQVCGQPGIVICVVGHSEFEKGNAEIAVTWQLNGKDAQLLSLAYQQYEQHWINIPNRHFSDRHLIDPPPLKRWIENGVSQS